MDFVNRQLECRSFFYSKLCFGQPVFCGLLFLTLLFYAGFVADHVGEKERVAERLEQEAVENPVTGSQHFWQGEYNPRVLATLKDRVLRGVSLVERCRATLNRIHEVMFPSDPRVQGINALLECFRGVAPIRNFITERLVMGANATMAYIRSQRPTLTFRAPAPGDSLSQQNMDGTLDSARLIIDRFRDQLDPIVRVKVEPDESE